MRAIAIKLALALATTAVSLLLAEIGMRIYGLYPPASFHTLPPNREFRDTQTDFDVTYDTDDNGLRTNALPLTKPQNVTRIVVIGDSFTFGQGCKRGEIFPDILQSLLRAEGLPVQVMNVSNIGIGPESYFVLLRDIALPYKPDIVVANVFANDASSIKQSAMLNSAVRKLSHYSNLFTLLRFVRRELGSGVSDFSRVLNEPRFGAFRKKYGTVKSNLVAACITDPAEVARWVDTPSDAEAWLDFEDYIGAMNELCKKYGCRLIMGVIPDGAQVDPQQVEVRQLLGVPVESGALDVDGKFQILTRDFATNRGIHYFDPLKDFR